MNFLGHSSYFASSRQSRSVVAVAIAVTVVALQVLIAPPASAGIAYRGGVIASGPAALYHPLGVAGDGEGNIYVADSNNHRIVKFGPNGAFIRSFGRGSPETAGTAGHLYYPAALTYANGDIYVADTSGNDVQEFTTEGTFVRKWGQFGQAEGDFNNPDGITSDCAGNIFVADPRN